MSETNSEETNPVERIVIPDHDHIWLIPDGDGGASWCDDPAPSPGMDEDDAIEYVRADKTPKLNDVLNKVRLLECASYTNPYDLRVATLEAIAEAFAKA